MKPFIRFFAVLFFPVFSAAAQTPLKITVMKPGSLPAEINVKAKAKEAVRFSDREGEHLVVISETGIYSSPADESMRHADLYAQHFLLQSGHYNATWTVHDFIKDCPVDLEARFVPRTFQVTDLNEDGAAEVWLMYTTVCHGDVSPSDMKVIVYQGKQKYAMRGQNQVKLSEQDVQGGDYEFDQAFKEGPAVFREYAKKLWKKHLQQKWN